MKTLNLFALLSFAIIPLTAMEVITVHEEHNDFAFFDKVRCDWDTMLVGITPPFHIASARHLPTMRLYAAYWDFDAHKAKAYFREHGEENTLDDAKAKICYEAFMKASSDTTSTEKKVLLNKLHEILK